MTGEQYKRAIAALGLNQREVAEWLGFSLRSSQDYANGHTDIPEPIAKLLRLCVRLKIKPEDVR